MKLHKKSYVIMLMLFLLLGCGNVNTEKNDIETLESFGLAENQSQAFYDYAKSTKEIFSIMETTNDAQEENDYIVNNDNYNTVKNKVKDAIDSYSALNPKNDNEFIEYFEDDSPSISGNPMIILDNIEEYKRTYSEAEAAMMYDIYYGFAEKGLKANGISNDNLDNAIDWYDDFNNYVGTIKKAYEYRRNNR